MNNTIKIKDRNRKDDLNQKIVQVYRKSEDFDVDLIVAKGEIVSAHRVILSMYSTYLRRILSQSNPESKFNGNSKQSLFNHYSITIQSKKLCALEKYVLFFYSIETKRNPSD